MYLGAAYLAAFALLMILVIIVYNMVARWTGHTAMGATAYAGYAMATSAFLAMAYTLNQDGHIRVRMLLNKLGNKKNGAKDGVMELAQYLLYIIFIMQVEALIFLTF